jgi:GNAT superfamily N-acetyltransferase
MDYRVATEEDLGELARMRWDFHCEDAPSLPLESREQFVRTCLEFLRKGLETGVWIYWVAAQEEALVAHIFVHLFHPVPRPDRPTENYGYMTNVYVKPTLRNQGIGTTLLQHVIAWAQAREVAFLMVSPSDRSIPFYRRAGFTDQTEWMQYDLDTP